MLMNALTKLNRQRIALLNGVEVMSHLYEGIVYVHNNAVVQFGEVIDNLTTNAKVQSLWDEYLWSEYDDEFLF